MGRRRRFLRPGPLTWVLVFLAVATLPSAAQAGSEHYILEAGHRVIEAVQRSDPATIVRPTTVVEMSNSRAAVFVIVFEGLPVSQVIAQVGSRTLDRVWTIVGTSALETAERNEPTFHAVIPSFEILTDPSPAYIGPRVPPSSSSLLGARLPSSGPGSFTDVAMSSSRPFGRSGTKAGFRVSSR